MWTIHNEEDEDGVIRDIQQTDFFDLLRDQCTAEQYIFLIVQMTRMAVDIFPELNCDIHNEVICNHQYIGCGPGDGEDEEEEEDYIITDDDDEEEDDAVVAVAQNSYISDEVE